MTLQDKFEAALREMGETLVKETDRYKVFTRSIDTRTFYYLGRSGALRFGRTTRDSTPCSESFRQLLLQRGYAR